MFFLNQIIVLKILRFLTERPESSTQLGQNFDI